MKTLAELSDTQRDALAIIDTHSCVFRRPGGWSARGSAIIEQRTMKVLVDGGLVRIGDVRRQGFTLTKATLTDTGEVVAEQLRNRQARRVA